MKLFKRKKKVDSAKQNRSSSTSSTGLPTYIEYPGSDNRSWNEIPIGVVEGENGIEEYVLNVSLSPNVFISGSTGSGKSVVQRNIINHCIQHSDNWRFFGIDLSGVEFSPYAQYKLTVTTIAADIPEGVAVLRYVQEEMMKRYIEMENNGVNHFKDLPNRTNALMIMIDGAYEFLAPSGIKTEEGKEEDALRVEALKLIGNITRLGRAAGVHLVLSAQRVDRNIIPPATLSGITSRIVLGKTDSVASTLALGNENGTLTNSQQRGAGYVQAFGVGEYFQGYFAPQKWIENYTNKTS